MRWKSPFVRLLGITWMRQAKAEANEDVASCIEGEKKRVNDNEASAQGI